MQMMAALLMLEIIRIIMICFMLMNVIRNQQFGYCHD